MDKRFLQKVVKVFSNVVTLIALVYIMAHKMQ